MSGEREAVEARARARLEDRGIDDDELLDGNLNYTCISREMADFSLAENAELLASVKRAEQERDDWKMDVAARDKKVEAMQAKYETAMVDLCAAIPRAEAAEAEVAKLHKEIEWWRDHALVINDKAGEMRCMLKGEAMCPQIEANARALKAEAVKLRDRLQECMDALKEMAEWHGGTHEDDCPMDDTCDCEHKPFNDRVNGAISRAESAMNPGAGKEEV
jgi:hypothetical protein